MESKKLTPEQKRELLAQLLKEKARQAETVAPLSHNQRAMWFLQQLAPQSSAYNLSVSAPFPYALDLAALRQALQTLSDRHATLRTGYISRAGEPFQVIRPHQPARLERVEAAGWTDEQILAGMASALRRPFDLANDEIWRTLIYSRGANDHHIQIVIHHIAADGLSIWLMLAELDELYHAAVRGERLDLPPVTSQYLDFVNWQTERLAGAAGEQLWSFWQEYLQAYPSLDLPTDFVRPAQPTFRGNTESFQIDETTAGQLRALARRHNTTLFTLLASAFALLLGRHANQEDILLATPVLGRNQVAFRQVVGDFVNTLPVRFDLSGQPDLSTLLGRAHRAVASALSHQDYPFALLVERLAPERELARNPIVQASINLLQPSTLGFDFSRHQTGLSIDARQQEGQFDLALEFTENGQQLDGRLRYSTDLFTGATAAQIIAQFQQLLHEFLAAADRPVNRLPLESAAASQRRLATFNDTARPLPAGQTVLDLFAAAVTQQPHAIALTDAAGSLTYKELDEQSRQLAAALQAAGLGAGDLVGLHLGRDRAMVMLALALWQLGAAYLPLDPNFPAERLAYIVGDAGCAAVISSASLAAQLSVPAGTRLLESETLLATTEPPANLPGSRPDQLAYVIYTSGSTGQPKGVEIEHGNLLNFLLAMQTAPGLAATDSLLAVTTLAFDISVLELFLPLTVGARVVIAAEPTSRDGRLLGQQLAAEQITVMQATPATWAMLLAANWQPAPSLRRALVGGERLPRHLAAELLAQGLELWNMYGPTETTIWSAVARVAPAEGPVTLGRPITNTQLYVLDGAGALAPAGLPGELCIGGLGVARGYRGRPDLTAARFRANPFGEGRLYHTGDIVRFSADGQLFFLGRADNQVKLRGYRIELEEIEHQLSTHPDVAQAVVVVQGEGDAARLAAFVSPARTGLQLAGAALGQFLAQALPAYMVPASFTQVDSFPQTPNRKIDRRRLAQVSSAPDHDAGETPANETEALIAGIWQSVLHVAEIGRRQNFFSLGGHSLLATQVMSRLHEATGLELPLADLFREPTVAGLAELVESARRTEPVQPLPPIQPLPRDQALPLAYAQERMWFLHQLAPDNAAYHIPTAVIVTGPQDEPRWRAAIDLLIQRHEGLRTIFRLENEQPVQEILPEFSAPYQTIDLMAVPAAEQEAQMRQIVDYYVQQPFDLAATPAWRMATIRLAPEKHVLLVVVHHIIFDQWSAGLFWNDLVLLYEGLLTEAGADLPALPVQYPDFAVWQREWLQGETLAQMLHYWREQLRDVATLTFPTDRPRPPMQTFNGGMVLRDIPDELVGRIRATSRAENVTHFMVMLAAFNLLLQKYTDQQDIVIGVPVANRHRLAVENIIGTFVNSLVMRSDLGGDPTFSELLARTRTMTLDAFAHQELPFEKLVEELQTARDFSRTPFFQIMFNMINAPFEPVAAADTDFALLEFSRQVAQFDFSVTTSIATHRSLKSQITIEYNSDLFDGDTMARLADHYLELLSQVTADPEKELSTYTILTEAERQQLARWNETALPYPEASCLHTLFSEQAARTPDRIAVADGRQRLTYAELEARANQLAGFLQSKGARPDMFVGLYTERHVDMVVGLLGILKSGAAYLPLDPAFPADRLAYMLEDSGASLMLTESKLVEFAPEFEGELICLDRDWPQIAGHSQAPISSAVTATNLAYIIYTSGSTGKPKGVLLQHQGVVNFLTSMRQQPGLTGDDTLLAVTTLSFDISVLEVFLPLTTGAKLVVVGKEIAADGWLLAEALAEHEATVMQATPVTWSMLIDTGWQGTPSLRKVLCGGEALSRELANQILARDVELWNMYGPTETTIWSAVEQITPGEAPITIGHPIGNTTFHILDRQGRPAPVGIPGELLIGGAGLARGYLHRPELTAERFSPDPFSDEPGARLYRTGDLARFRADGRVEFMGRLDFQVKVRGYRIELGEIEHVMDRHAAIREAVVIAREDNPGDKRLVAYYQLQNGAENPSNSAWRSFLGEHLPDYMIPSQFMPLEAFPLTPNRKVDRKALPAPAGYRPARERPYVPPSSDVEHILAETLAEILTVARVGATDNFFELGGHSLQATRYVARVNKTFRTDLPLRAFLQRPTVQDLATYLLALPEAGRRVERSAQLLRRIANMSDEEVKAMLAQRKAAG